MLLKSLSWSLYNAEADKKHICSYLYINGRRNTESQHKVSRGEQCGLLAPFLGILSARFSWVLPLFTWKCAPTLIL